MRNRLRSKLLIGVLVMGVVLLIGWFTSVRGVVYQTTTISDINSRQPAAGRTVYLLAGDWNSSRILQTTRTDAAGYFWFFGAPLSSYTVAVVVGEFESGSFFETSHPRRLYCTFTFQPESFHTITLPPGEHTQSFIYDFGHSLYGDLQLCPE